MMGDYEGMDAIETAWSPQDSERALKADGKGNSKQQSK